MLPTLVPGIKKSFTYKITPGRCVPGLLPESPEFSAMPEVLATGYMVGLVEWACIQAVNPHLDWPSEMTVGTHVNLSHTAATPPGMEITIDVKLEEISGRKLVFAVEARDECDPICTGTHERAIIYPAKFIPRVEEKSGKAKTCQNPATI